MIQEGVLLPIPTPLAPTPVDEVNRQNHQSCRNFINEINSNAMILIYVPPGLLCERGQPELQGLALAQQRGLELVHERGACLIAEGSTKRREKLNGTSNEACLSTSKGAALVTNTSSLVQFL